MEKIKLHGQETFGTNSKRSWAQLLAFTLCAVITAFSFKNFNGQHSQTRYNYLGISQEALLDGRERCHYDQQRPRVDYTLPGRRLVERPACKDLTVFKNASLIDGDGDITFDVTIRIRDGIVDYVATTKHESDETQFCDWEKADTYELFGRYVTPGLVDMHSHVGVRSEPALWSTEDVTEVMFGPITPWARAIDGLKPDDSQITALAAGGITTSLVLTGAKNLISGEGIAIKMKDTYYMDEIALDTTGLGSSPKPHRYLKMACGENVRRQYEHTPGGPNSRLGASFLVRHAFEKAKKMKEAQENWCQMSSSSSGQAQLQTVYPTSLELQTLIDVLRGDVLVNVHCYESQDVHAMYNHANEFGFNISALHHILEGEQLLEEIKRHGTMLATFSDEWGFKREAWGASAYMLKHASEYGIPVVVTSDHPAKAGQFLAYEAQIGHHFGLSQALTIASITSVPAKGMGLDNRIGYMRPGYDADLIVWDRHPLSLGAKPLKVMIEGEARVQASDKLWNETFVLSTSLKPAPKSRKQMNAEDNACRIGQRNVVLRGIYKSFLNNTEIFLDRLPGNGTSVIQDGKIQCIGGDTCEDLAQALAEAGVPEIHLKNGQILPGLSLVTKYHGLSEMVNEASTMDGTFEGSQVRRPYFTADGLKMGGEHLRRAHRNGVLRLITPPSTSGFLHGVSAAFRTGACSVLDLEAISKNETALHFSIGHESKTPLFPTISAQVGALRDLLTVESNFHYAYRRAAQGDLPVIIHTGNKDVIAQMILLKHQLPSLEIVIMGGSEAHLLAHELAASSIPVIVAPWICTPLTWEEKNCPPTPPLADETIVELLLAAGVKVALGNWDVRDRYVRNAIWEASWVAGASDPLKALQLVSTNVEEILKLEPMGGVVVYEGDPFQFGANVAIIIEGGEIQKCWPDVE